MLGMDSGMAHESIAAKLRHIASLQCIPLHTALEDPQVGHELAPLSPQSDAGGPPHAPHPF